MGLRVRCLGPDGVRYCQDAVNVGPEPEAVILACMLLVGYIANLFITQMVGDCFKRRQPGPIGDTHRVGRTQS